MGYVILLLALIGLIVYFIIKSWKKVKDEDKKVFKQYGESDLKGAKDYISNIRKEREAKEVFMPPNPRHQDSGIKQMESEISHVFIQSMMNEDLPPHHHIDHSDQGGGGSFGGGGSSDSWSDNSSSFDSSSDCGSSSND